MSKVKDAINTALNELEYVKTEIEEVAENNENLDLSIVIKYIDDAKSAIDNIEDEFETYNNEVADIEDDLEGLVKRLSEVSK